MTDVIVLHAALHGHFGTELEATLLPRLPYAKRLQLESRGAGERHASLLGIELLLRGAAKLAFPPLDPARIRFPDGGKPQVECGPCFSIAHTPRRVAVALSASREVGIDLEDYGTHGVLEGAERSRLERWTATEAALKAVGAGLRSAPSVVLAPDLETARIGEVTVHLRPLLLGVGQVARLASRGVVEQVTIEEVGP